MQVEVLHDWGAGAESEIELGHGFECWTKRPNREYRESISLRLPDTFVAQNSQLIASGKAHACIADKYLVHNANPTTIFIPNNAISSIELIDEMEAHGEQRRLSKEIRAGPKNLLVVRILSDSGNEEPPETVVDIRKAIFGPLGTQEEADEANRLPTVVSQYAAVSHGSLQYVPATGLGIKDGVVEVTIETSIFAGTSSIQGPLMKEILEATSNSLGNLDQIADHIIFCLPTGSLLKGKTKWTAFTYLYEPVSSKRLVYPSTTQLSHLNRICQLLSQYSYYQQSRCTKLSVTMHEMGHSLGFKHSGKEGDSYGDESGYMGYAINKSHFPQKAFVRMVLLLAQSFD